MNPWPYHEHDRGRAGDWDGDRLPGKRENRPTQGTLWKIALNMDLVMTASHVNNCALKRLETHCTLVHHYIDFR